MMLNEQKYDSLIAEIEKNRNLVESDRFLFYELHKKVSKPNDFVLNRILIPELIHQMRYNDRMKLIEDEEKEIANFLEKRRSKNIGLNRYEYNYLSYLNEKYKLNYELNSPCYPRVQSIGIKDFEELVAFNSSRNKLFEILINGLRRCGELYRLEIIEAIIGGSLVDKHKINPGDVDVIILLPQDVFWRDLNNATLNTIINEFKDDEGSALFDLLKIPSNSDKNLYLNYEQLTLIGNTPANKSEEQIKTNSFRCRDIFKLTLSLTEL
jgi:hypothetical protein